MLKVLFLSLVLFNFTASRSLPEDPCEADFHRWAICFGETGENREIYRNLGQKESLKCVGEIKCGALKFMKFNLESITFAREQFEGDAFDCINGTNKEQPLTACIFGGASLNNWEDYVLDEKIISCAERVLEETECSVEDKKAFMRAAKSIRDFLATTRTTFADKDYTEAMKHFDKTFDPTQYF